MILEKYKNIVNNSRDTRAAKFGFENNVVIAHLFVELILSIFLSIKKSKLLKTSRIQITMIVSPVKKVPIFTPEINFFPILVFVLGTIIKMKDVKRIDSQYLISSVVVLPERISAVRLIPENNE